MKKSTDHHRTEEFNVAVWRLLQKALDGRNLSSAAKLVLARIFCTDIHTGWGQNCMFQAVRGQLSDVTPKARFAEVIGELQRAGFLRVDRQGDVDDWMVFVGPAIADALEV